jgi:RDD family
VCFTNVTGSTSKVKNLLWPAARPAARNGYRGVVAKKQLTVPPVTDKTPAYPGQRFGLPQQGPGSVASMGRRVLALLIDWLLSMLIAYWLTHSQFWTILVFSVETFMLTALTGSTVGQRLLGLRVIRTNGGRVSFGWSLVRTAILLTVVPPLLTDRDLRGLHDRAADTIVVRL